MADAGIRDVRSEAAEGHRLVAPRPARRAGRYISAAFSLLLLGSLVWVYAAEALPAPAAVGVAVGAAGLVACWPWLRARRVLVAVGTLNLALVLAYFWALDEVHRVVISVHPSGTTASVDGNAIVLPRSLSGDGFGLQQGTYDSYRFQGTGEQEQDDTASPLGRLAASFRLAQPASAWSHLEVISSGRHHVPVPGNWSARSGGAWTQNRRGEWMGIPGSTLLFPGPGPSYTLSVDLMRPDGTQSILVGVDSRARGYALLLRFDQPDILWAPWQTGTPRDPIAGVGVHHLDVITGLKRDIRTLLTGYLFALVFMSIALGSYPLLVSSAALVSRAAGRGTESGMTPVDRPRAAARPERAPSHRFLLEAVTTRAPTWAPFCFVFGIGLVSTIWVSTILLDRIPHVQDSVAYVFQARIFALGRFSVPAPPAIQLGFFTEEFIPFHEGKWFAQYPPGQSLVLAAGVLAGAPWLVGPLLSSLSLGLVFLLGRSVYNARIGFLAAALGLLSPFWVFLGSSYMSHPAGLFFTAGVLYCVGRWERGRDWRWIVLGSFLAGMDFLTRPLTMAGSLFPIAVYVAVVARRDWRVYPAAAAGMAAPIAFFLLYNWSLMGDPLRSTYLAWNPLDTPGFGPKPGGYLSPGDGLWNTFQNLSILEPHLYGWPYGVALSIAFIPFVTGAARRWDYLLLASLGGVMVAYACYHTTGIMYGPRYYYEAMPSLLLLTARGLWELGRLPLRLWPRLSLRTSLLAAAAFPIALGAALSLYCATFYLPAQLDLYRDYNYSSDAELRAVKRANIHHAIVFVVQKPSYAWWAYGNVFFANDPLLRGDVIYARDFGPSDPTLYSFLPGRSHYRLNGTKLTRMP